MSNLVKVAPKVRTATIKKDTLTYTPNANYAGADSLYVTTTWGCQKSAPAKIKITVTTAILAASELNGAYKEQNAFLGWVDGKARPSFFCNIFYVRHCLA